MIHVAYRLWGGDGFFAKMLGTSMLSMFENTKEKVTVHVMHNDRLTPDNRGKICYIAGQYNQRVEFHNVEEIAGPTLRKIEAVHPIESGINAAWYPLIIHEVFPDLDKIIFLGADTVFNLDIAELWEYDLDSSGYEFGAVPEVLNETPGIWLHMVRNKLVKYEDYFNGDVLLVKTKFFRRNFEDILRACKFVYDNKYKSNEQDALNYSFSNKYLKLPLKFNVMIRNMRFLSKFHIDKGIYHFAVTKPEFDTDDIFNRLYFDYFLKTPWATADMFGNLDKAIRKIYAGTQDNLLYLTNLIAKKQRAFFIENNFLKIAKQTFNIKNYELIITPSNGIDKLLQELTASKEKKVFYILFSNYPQLVNFLRNQNFVEGVDFLNGFMFFSERHGSNFKFDTKKLVQEM